MASNTLTDLTPDLYEALDVVSRELVGFIPAVSRDSNVERAAKDQTVRSFVAPASSASDISPAQNSPDSGEQTIGNKTITISEARQVPVQWDGIEQKSMNHGSGYNNILQDQFAQAMRTLVNEIEVDLAGLHAKASRAQAPAGTNLFDADNFKDAANVRKILADNGAPLGDMHLILSTASAARLRGANMSLNRANEAGNVAFREQGILLPIHGMSLRESAQVVDDFTKGTGANYLVNSASLAVGSTTIPADGGTGTIIAGDIVKFEDDSNEYVVTTALSGGSFTIAEPGLLTAVADNKTITLQDQAERNMAFTRNAMHLVTRVPERPAEGDQAEDVMIIQDPRSGLAFEIAIYPQYRRVHYEVSIAWGFEMIKPEHAALLVD